MPIRADLRQFYGREWREITRPRILARAGDRCELCGKPNHRHLYVFPVPADQVWAYRRYADTWHSCTHNGLKANFQLCGREARRIRVVLTIAHLNHQPGDDRDQNLKALCQWCHLNHDRKQHRETRSARKDRGRPLLAPLLQA
jgi:hypothetical protein